MLTKVLEATPNDVEVLIDLAQLLEGVDPHKSLTLYENACDLIKTSEDGLQIDPPAAILNNIGALHMTLENYERAKEYFKAAEAKLQEDLEGDLCDSKLSSYVITMRYNLARCLEHLCLFEDAEVLYKGILREQENYTDFYNPFGHRCKGQNSQFECSRSSLEYIYWIKIDDLDFFIGDEALSPSAANYSAKYPIRHGIVEDWDLMERFWEQCIFKYLRAEPEDHFFLLAAY
ncbi:unnamed protein product [Cylicocyclus nassatus]|uniref:Uncharacterized protein n=1 Tax=Cylicocyclus nassatus TaxID=53992 RepID=A0AA36GXY2_CYLNA|nr:unnamed protein product [Cylicocyclus nassatus]